jgi:DNA polymerase I-like protein with 3'-5' exonuclease and polymerase domains
MKISCDASGLEWNVAAFLSQDEVAIQEIIDEFDIHSDNQRRFGLPIRRIAKIFLFRLIYGGSAWSFALDPDFNFVSRDPAFWQGIIDATYSKYRGLKKWHDEIVLGVMRDRKWESPTGRIYEFEPVLKRGRMDWPRTTILNYPVQGLAADIMMLIRISFARRFKAAGFRSKLVNTIHDSIEVDALPEEWYNISRVMKETFRDLPANFERMFGVPYNIPLRCEIKLNEEPVDFVILTDKELVTL